jgi:hypothetical protein
VAVRTYVYISHLRDAYIISRDIWRASRSINCNFNITSWYDDHCHSFVLKEIILKKLQFVLKKLHDEYYLLGYDAA